MKLLSKIVANDKKHSLSAGELHSPSLALLDHKEFNKNKESFETLMKMNPVEFRKCVLVNEDGLEELTNSMIKETVRTFKKDEFDQAILESGVLLESNVKKPVKAKENKKALQVLNF